MGGFCEKRPEASPVSDRAKTDLTLAKSESISGGGRWQCLWDKKFNKGRKNRNPALLQLV